MTIFWRTIPTRTITKKPMIMKKLTFAIHSQHRDLNASDGLLRPMGDFNVYGRFRCRFAADAAIGINRFNYRLQADPLAPGHFALHPAFAAFAGALWLAELPERIVVPIMIFRRGGIFSSV